MTNNKQVLKFVNDAVELCQPEKVVWITGEEAQLEELRKEAWSTGELIKLNDEVTKSILDFELLSLIGKISLFSVILKSSYNLVVFSFKVLV